MYVVKAYTTILHEWCPPYNDATVSDLHLIKANMIMYSVERHRGKCCKYSFAHPGGPVNIANVRSCLLAVSEMREMFVLAYYWLSEKWHMIAFTYYRAPV